MRRIQFVGVAALAVVGFSQALFGCGADPENGGSSGGPLVVGTPGNGSLGFRSTERVIPGRSSTIQ